MDSAIGADGAKKVPFDQWKAEKVKNGTWLSDEDFKKKFPAKNTPFAKPGYTQPAKPGYSPAK